MQSHFFFVAANAKTGKSRLDQKCGYSAGTGSGVSLGKNQVDAGDATVRDPCLGAIQDVMIAFAYSASLYAGSVRASLRLCKAKGTKDFATGKRREVFLFLRLAAKFPNGNTHYGIRDAEGDGGRCTNSRDFFEHQRVADRVGARAAPLLGHEHSAAAEFAKFTKLLSGKFPFALVFAQNGAHFCLHKLADGVPDQKLVATE